MTNELHSTARFSDRVDAYVRYRPDYPLALLDWLQREHGVDSGWRVADVGAGTGMLRALRELFDRCAGQGVASFDYDTRIFVGELA